MLHEEEGTNHIGSNPVSFGSWPPQGNQSSRPWGFMTKVTRGPGGRPVEWPPRSELSQSQEHLDQVPRKPPSEPAPPPVPPRPANYPQANMDQVQVEQQQQNQQMVMQQQQQQQQRQQVSSSVQMKTVKQVQEFQTYEQQFSGGSQGTVRYQVPPQQQQQSFQHQTSQKTVSSTGGQQVPQGMERQVPIQMRPAGAPQHQGPRHGVPTPFANANSMTPPQSANQNAFPSQFANQNAAPPQQFANQNATPPQQFANQNAAPPQQFANQNAAPPQQFANQNAAPQQSFQNVRAPPPTQNANPAQYNTNENANPTLMAAAQKASEPVYTSGTTQDNPDGYTSAYSAIHGEWPPKQENDAPNLTTTYPSGFKLKDHATFKTGPAKVVTSQPAFKITQPIRRSGDDKWPPRGAGEPTQEEVREFVKPKKSNKNYSEFFAQNALPHNYAGYRAPPGTQHFGLDGEEEDGVSNM